MSKEFVTAALSRTLSPFFLVQLFVRPSFEPRAARGGVCKHVGTRR